MSFCCRNFFAFNSPFSCAKLRRFKAIGPNAIDVLITAAPANTNACGVISGITPTTTIVQPPNIPTADPYSILFLISIKEIFKSSTIPCKNNSQNTLLSMGLISSTSLFIFSNMGTNVLMFFADQNHLSQCFFFKLLITYVTLAAHPTTMTIATESSIAFSKSLAGLGVSESSTGVLTLKLLWTCINTSVISFNMFMIDCLPEFAKVTVLSSTAFKSSLVTHNQNLVRLSISSQVFSCCMLSTSNLICG